MPKILLTGDWQIEARPSNDRLDEYGLSVRFAENIRTIKQMLKAGWDAGCRILVHTGDLTEHKNPKSLEVKAAAECFRYWIELGGTIVAAAGNHDGAAFSLSSSSFAGLAIMAGDKFRVAHEITYYEDLNLVVLPYLHNKTLAEITDLHRQVRSKVRSKTMPWLMGHYGVQNCVVGAYNQTVPGDMLGKDQVFPDGLGYSVAFFGHIHKQQVVKMMNVADPVDCVFPGSPVIMDFGERNDPKGYAIFDTETGRYDLHQLVPEHEWVEVSIGDGTQPVEASWATPSWSAGAILKFVGVYDGKIHPRQLFKKAVANKQVPEPFCPPVFEVRALNTGRTGRGDSYAKMGSLKEAAAAYIKDKFKDKPGALVDQVLAMVNDAIKDGQATPWAADVQLVAVLGHNFMTYKDLRYDFKNGEPVLFTGPIGLGKTNLMEAILFCLTGLTSKKLPISSLLRRGAADGWLRLILIDVATGSLMTIERTLKRSARGVAHKINVTVEDQHTGGPVDWVDGGVKEVQENLNRTLCVPYELVRTCYFMFQRMHDPEPFVMLEPLARKKVLTEIFGLGSLVQALKRLNDSRLVAAKALDTERNKLEGMTILFDAKAKVQLMEQVTALEGQVFGARVQEKSCGVALGAQEQAVSAQELALEQARTALEAVPDTGKALAAAQASLEAENSSYAENDALLRTKWATLDTEAKAQAVLASKTQVDHWRAELAKVQASVSTCDTELQTVAGEVATAEAATKAQAQAIQNKQIEIDKLKAGNIDECPSCKQKVDSSHIKAEIVKARAEMDKLLAASPALDVVVAAKKTLRTERQTTRTALGDLVTSYQKSLDDDLKVHTDLETKRLAVSTCVSDGTAAKAAHLAKQQELVQALNVAEAADEKTKDQRLALGQELEALKVKLETLKTTLTGARSDHQASVQALQALELGLKNAEEKLAEHLRVADLIKASEALIVKAEAQHEVHVLSCEALDPKLGLPVYLVDSHLDYLGLKINEYLTVLGRPDINLTLTTQDGDKETLAIIVDDGATDSEGQPLERLDIRAYSGGQLTLMELSIKMALADLVADTRECRLGMFMVDEPSEGGLHDEDKDALIELLQDRARSGWPAVLVISHDEKLRAAFGSHLEAEAGAEGETVLTMR